MQKHDTTHYIDTTGPPVYLRHCRLDSDEVKIAKHEFEHIAKPGVIRSSKSE